MEEVSKRLVEVEFILKLLNEENLRKIPNELWNYIVEYKDKDYKFDYDNSKTLNENNLHIDTISMLTYINTEYLLEEQQKSEILDLIKQDQKIAEENKRKKYNPDVFKIIREKKDQATNEMQQEDAM